MHILRNLLLIYFACRYRPKWEGGQYEGNDNKRFEALLLAMELGAEHVDIELKVNYVIYIHLSIENTPLILFAIKKEWQVIAFDFTMVK